MRSSPTTIDQDDLPTTVQRCARMSRRCSTESAGPAWIAPASSDFVRKEFDLPVVASKKLWPKAVAPRPTGLALPGSKLPHSQSSEYKDCQARKDPVDTRASLRE